MRSLTSRSALLALATTLAAAACAPVDQDVEPGDSELAVDEIRGADCAGPFDCRLPNPNRENSNSNRYDIPGTDDDTWPLTAGTHLRDGSGTARGVVANSQIQVNYGQLKFIDGFWHVFAFGVALTDGSHGSGWVRRANITDDRIRQMPDVHGRNPGMGDYDTVFHVTDAFTGMYGTLKVVPNSSSAHEAAADYLDRGGVVYMLYSLPGVGGVATDALPIGATFRRARGVRAIDIPLYWPGGTNRDSSRPTMRFVYGHSGSRYGWIARDAIQ
jgi:hypothetical protein